MAFIALLHGAQAASAQAANTKHSHRPQILILNSYDGSFIWTNQEMSGIMESLHKEFPGLDPMVEYLDWKRYPDQQNIDLLVDLFRYRYAKRNVDIIIATDNAALDFAVKYRSVLFSNAPIVFCGISGYEQMKLPPDVTGVTESIDPIATMKIALSLHPKVKEVAIVMDRTESSIAIRRQIESVLPQFKGQHKEVKFWFVDDISEDELASTIDHLPADSMVLMLAFNRDRNGTVLSHESSLKLVVDHSRVPVYQVWDWALGGGIVGGALLSGKDQGKFAAEMASQVLHGKDASKIPVMTKVPTPPEFDYAQMKRFGISLSIIPSGSKVINKPFSLYDTYKRLIWSTISVVLLLLLVVVILSVNIAHRKQAEDALRDSEERYRQLFVNSPEIVAVFRDELCVAISPSAVKILGYELNEMVGQPAASFTPVHQPDGRESISKLHYHMERAVTSGKTQLFEWAVIRKDGLPVHLEVSLVCYTLRNKESVLAIGRDITARKQAEDTNRLMEQEMEDHKRHFYRETILSVTEGKLDVCDAAAAQAYTSTARRTIHVKDAVEVSNARNEANKFYQECGMIGDRLEEFIIGVGEAITNAVKHSDGGTVYLGCNDDDVWVAVMDQGAGIDSLILPRATLRRGFSTKPSLGLGYSIMLDVADHILLNTSPHGTTVILVKSLKESDPVAGFGDIPETWDLIEDI